MVTITMPNNNRFELSGNMKVLTKLYKKFKVKHPGAFYLRKSGTVQKGWDGCIDYISENLKFNNGLLGRVVSSLEELGEKVTIVDNRLNFNITPILPKFVGKHELRGNQKECVKAVIYNKVCGVPYYTAVLDAATNAGKTTIMAGLYHAFQRKIPCIVLLKDGDLFEQFKRELPNLIPTSELGFVRGKDINFANFTVAMVQTLSPKAAQYKNQLAKFGMVLVDEADEGDSKSYKTIIKYLFNTNVRVGLSGSIYMSKLKKDNMKNMNLRSFYGDVLHIITKVDMVKAGYSTPGIVKIWPGSNKPGVPRDYQAEYQKNITENKQRAKAGAKRMIFNAKMKRLPAVIIYRYHDHGKLLLKVFRDKLSKKYRIELVHGQTKNRKDLLKQFREGKIDILISSFIIKRGKNFPKIKYIQNASATDSQETISQIMGRGERKDDSKDKYYLDDFFDEGIYLKRHSKHRVIYYKKQGMPVIEKYK